MYLLLIFSLVVVCSANDPLQANIPSSFNCSHLLNVEEPTDVYPTFPATSFTCWGRYDGYYADIEVDCTIFHYCQTWHFPTGLNETVKWDFACPQSTIFNQKILSCTQPSISFDCQESPNYFWVNLNYTSTTPLSTTTPETTTPGSNLGQQLIVEGVGPQSAELSESTDAPPIKEPEEGNNKEPEEENKKPEEENKKPEEENKNPEEENKKPEGDNKELEEVGSGESPAVGEVNAEISEANPPISEA